MESDNIRLLEQFVQGSAGHAQALLYVWLWWVRVIIEKPGAKGPGQVSDPLPNLAQADNSDSFTVEGVGRQPGIDNPPVVSADVMVQFNQAAIKGQHQHQGMLGHIQ
jgi:hypothetical protein